MYNNNHSMQQIATNFMYKVYGWMSLALALTGITAFAVANTAMVYTLARSSGLLFLLCLIQLGLVFFLSAFINKMELGTAITSFVSYAILTGLGFSTLFLVYTGESLASTFLITAGMFGAMALYGYFTKSDLTQMGSILMMALFGLIITMVVNMFMQSSTLAIMIAALGVLIFAGLTAYDVQKIKSLSYQLLDEGQMRSKVAILGALTLYLDFINLFLMLLQFTGKRRD